MQDLEFEPFGEPLTRLDAPSRGGRASKWLLRIGTAAFWSLVIAIVLARAAYFDSTVFSGFERLAGLARNIF